VSKQTAIRLPDATYERLQALARRTGRTAAYYIREALELRLDEMEDLYLAERATERRLSGQERTYTFEEAERELGLND
jgi:RHH-type rel operon transcriptional repressor/antitoxin RelB